MSKYGAQKTVVNGIAFDSKLEAERFEQLLWLEKAGEIEGLKLQEEFQIFRGYTVSPDDDLDDDGVTYTTIPPQYERKPKKHRSSFYLADFTYFDNKKKRWIAEDTKGMETPDFRLKWKLVQSQYPEYEFRKITKDQV